MDNLDEITRQQLKYGNWDAIITEGLLINRDRLEQNVISISDELPVFSVIGIDQASKGSDRFSMCCLTLMNSGLFYAMTSCKDKLSCGSYFVLEVHMRSATLSKHCCSRLLVF